ncbi:MAG: phosphatidylserine decarboxylase [Chloroflexota bacterium]|nr:phosphatidylserine decarboxylase [Chloroflexota bacterium]
MYKEKWFGVKLRIIQIHMPEMTRRYQDYRIPIAHEGCYLAGGSLCLAALTAYRNWRWSLLPIAVAGIAACFFRDPERALPTREDGRLYAPADGQVLLVDEVEEEDFIKGPAYRIAIYLSLFDVHINRSPTTGIVRYRKYVSGTFHPAWNKNVPTQNERHYLGVETARGPILVVQMAGIVARRIVCWPQEGEAVMAGERIGLIRFGSRTDLLFPKSMGRPLVAPGLRVYAALTPVAGTP